MTAKVNTHNGIVEVPTATEFYPADDPATGDDDRGMITSLQRVVDGKGIEQAYHEPYDDEVENRVVICDQCGQAEDSRKDMEFHLRTEHEIES